MKIGIYPAEYSRKLGGSARFEFEVVNAIAKAQNGKHEFCILGGTDRRTVDLPHVEVPQPVPVTRTSLLLQRTGFAKDPSIAIRTSLQAAGIDLVFSAHPSTLCEDVPYIVTCWDLEHRVLPFFPEVSHQGWTWKNRQQHYRTVLRRAAGVITGTQRGQQEIERFFGVDPDRISIIPFFVPQTLVASESIKPDWAPESPFLFYPAQFWPHKNHVTVLHALKRLQDNGHKNLTVVFSGSANLDHYCTKQYVADTAESLGVSIMTPGFVSDENLRWLYEHAQALVYASLFGPDNLPPLEAMSLGCPVVASEVSGSKEQFGDAALLVPPANENEMAAAIDRLLKDQAERTQWVERGRKWVEHLTMDHYVRELFELFDRFATYRRCWPSTR
ncbi:glycosyltransferase family 4 protein [Novipirellula artificiosorum]|uniref:D-inositol-3-phosphate glycosyltransferase n=1 Tax=Novipirellula artificiosorum TaxID=2528016 RepID=A0A5C6DF12_9BACT|nr:glycosyltransferase family 1 protein [Novipirellula artificiosorum]TWU34524.1 D-inositol-3-phosphate glycosyltransferase [Novipirellula artificiosorum]